MFRILIIVSIQRVTPTKEAKMNRLGIGILALLIVTTPMAASAIALPDESSCNKDYYCLRLSNTNASGNTLELKSTTGTSWSSYSKGGTAGYFWSYGAAETTLEVANYSWTGKAAEFSGQSDFWPYPGQWAASFMGETSFSNRLYIWENADEGATAGIWYADGDGWARQFAGVKVHTATGTNQEWGIWQNGAWNFYFRGNGSAYKPGGGSWSSPSDARCKEDITTFAEGLAAVERIRPVWYRYNGRGGTPTDGARHIGVIAQELEDVAPYMVQEVEVDDPSIGLMKTVDPGALPYVLVNAVKDLSAQNRQLRQETSDLSKQLDGLRRELEELKRAVLARK